MVPEPMREETIAAVRMVPGQPALPLGAYDLAELGYVTEEFFISGKARSYASSVPLSADGDWNVSPAETASYTTRLVVLRPADASRFSGSVIVEWLNVSGGLDAPPDWLMAHREIIRTGHAYVAVSAQKVGIDGGISLGADMSLKKIDALRYGELVHPGDAFAYDIFSEAGRIVSREGSEGVLGGLVARHVLAVGESQSAHFLTTYVNAIDPFVRIYDGFLIHSRFAGSAPLDGSSIMGAPIVDMPSVVMFRPDLRVPVITIITETDLVGVLRPGYLGARQPDSDRLRVWEIAGTAHADNYTLQVASIDNGSAPLDRIVAAYAPTTSLMGMQLAKPINFAPQHHYVVQAALSALDRWVHTGRLPPNAGRIRLTVDEPPVLALDANGLAEGGIRTPWVDVPVARLSGGGNDESILGSLFGSGEPFDAEIIARLYPGGKQEYLERFTASLNSCIEAGFMLPADRAEVLELAGAMFP